MLFKKIMAKSVLKVRYEYPFEVIGIVSGVKDYRLCHFINSELKMSFCKMEDLSMVMNKQGDDAFFSYYTDISQETERFMMITNKGSNAWFFPEIKNIDFLLIAQDPGSWFDAQEMLRKLRTLSVVSGAYPIDYEKLKSKENLLYLS
jgi:hypothetical protein